MTTNRSYEQIFPAAISVFEGILRNASALVI